MGKGRALAAPAAVAAALAGVCLLALAGGTGQAVPQSCATGRWDADSVTSPRGPQAGARWTAEQQHNAATVTRVARERGLPPRAAVIAVATAIQESRLVNLRHGDRDSVGLFQQRPSQGWGTAAQLADPAYASGRFYDALLTVPHWRTRPLTEAAQSVQRSAHPGAYAPWEEAAGRLVTDAWGCRVPDAFRVSNPRTPAEAVAAARRAEGRTGWYRLCDNFVAQAYGYATSGSATANAHWRRLSDLGLAHPDDAAPPAGALLFYATGRPAGHVALYLGDDLVASNDILDTWEGEGRIALVPRHELTDGRWRLTYLGWAEPGFPGATGTGTL